MSKKYDNSFREMFSRHFVPLLPWLLPDVESVKVLKLPESLPTTTRWVDLVILVRLKARQESARRGRSRIVVFECQCQQDKKLQRTMLLRAVLAHSLYGKPVKTILLALTPSALVPSLYVYGEGEDGGKLHHSVIVRRVFEESGDAALARNIDELLPLVTVMRSDDGDQTMLAMRVFERIVQRILDEEQRTMMLEQAATFATLRLPKQKVDGMVMDVLRRNRIMLDPLRDFPYLRDTYSRGKAESVLTILETRGVRVPKAIREKILSCTDPATLDRWLRNAVSATSAAEALAAN